MGVLEEARIFLPGLQRMDLLISGVAPGRTYLAVDLSSVSYGGSAALDARERHKEAKYSPSYGNAALVRGCAFNYLGVLGSQGAEAISRMVDVGVRACGGHPEDLRRELLATFGHAMHTASAFVFARAGWINNDRGRGVPLLDAAAPAGPRHRSFARADALV